MTQIIGPVTQSESSLPPLTSRIYHSWKEFKLFSWLGRAHTYDIVAEQIPTIRGELPNLHQAEVIIWKDGIRVAKIIIPGKMPCGERHLLFHIYYYINFTPEGLTSPWRKVLRCFCKKGGYDNSLCKELQPT